jgi:hypothetical protein
MRITALNAVNSLGSAGGNTARAAWITLAILAAGVTVLPAPAAEQSPLVSLANLATALSESDSDTALDYFDSQMKGYRDLERNIEALTAQTDISCSIDVVTDMEENGVHKLDLDWYMQLKSIGDNGPLERRRERVLVEMRSFKGVWKITSLSPASILDPLLIR